MKKSYLVESIAFLAGGLVYWHVDIYKNTSGNYCRFEV